MKTRLVLAFSLSLFIILSGCIPGVTIKGDGNLVTEKIDIGDYDRIVVTGSKIVINYVQSAGQPALAVTTDKNIFELYDFTVESGKLLIKPKKEEKWTIFLPTEFTITTNSSTISEVKAEGAVTFNANSPIESEELKIDFAGSGVANLPELVKVNTLKTNLAGSGTINAAELCLEKYEGDIAGSGTLNLGGETDKMKLSIGGSGRVKAFELLVKELDCNIAGSGNIEMSVSDKISASIAGSGNIRYKGNPGTIMKQVAGSGSIKPAE